MARTIHRAYARIDDPNWLWTVFVLNQAGVLPNGEWRDTGWSPPGGGVKPEDEAKAAESDDENVTPQLIAAVREVREETGDEIADAVAGTLHEIGTTVKEPDAKSSDRIIAHVFHGLIYPDPYKYPEPPHLPIPDCSRDKVVTEARWFDMTHCYFRKDARGWYEGFAEGKGEDGIVRPYRFYNGAAVRFFKRCYQCFPENEKAAR